MDESPPDVARGPIHEVRLTASCPTCGKGSLLLRSMPLDLPYFGDALQTTILCQACGFRHADPLLTRAGKPARATLHVSKTEHLSARVARSSSGTIRIPELDASMEPGPRAKAFVSNIEGVLRRFLDVVRGQEATAEDRTERERILAVRRRIEGMVEGHEPFTLVLEDPTGNSDISHADVVRRVLTREEAASLRSPESTIDLSALVHDADG